MSLKLLHGTALSRLMLIICGARALISAQYVCTLAGFALCIFLLFSTVAHANETSQAAIVSCDQAHNRFMIRFGLVNEGEALDKASLPLVQNPLASELLHVPVQKAGTCVLANKQSATIVTQDGQAFAYGMGGADPDTFFTLTLDEKNIYFKYPFYLGHSVGQFSLSAIIYDGTHLFQCDASEANVNSSRPQKSKDCVDVSARLAGNVDALSPEEKGALQKHREKIDLAKNLSGFCKAIEQQTDPDQIEEQAERTRPAYRYVGQVPDNGVLSVNEIDMNNDGRPDPVLRIAGSKSDCRSCGNHYFDGSFLIAFLHSTSHVEEAKKFLLETKIDIESIPTEIAKYPEWQASLYSIGFAQSSVRYIYNVPFIREGKTYIYSFETNEEIVPSSSLSQITAVGTTETLCKFP